MQPKTARDLLRVDAKDRAACEHYSLAHLTAYSVYWLDRWGIVPTFENVSVLNARLFPADFAMREWPNFPDAFRTNRTILQMRPKYRGFATSDPRKGVFLTERGRAEAERVARNIGSPTLEGKAAAPVPVGVDPRRPRPGKERATTSAEIIETARSKVLFRRFQEDRLADTDVVHLLGLLGLYDHTPPKEVRREFKQLRDAASDLNDSEFVTFLDAVADQFRQYLDRPDSLHRAG
jgi:hypothetical protein